MTELTEEQRRALAYREKEARLKARRDARARALAGDNSEAQQVRDDWRPLTKRPEDTSIP